MFRHTGLFFITIIMINAVTAQQLSIPELKKIAGTKKSALDSFMASKKYERTAQRSEGALASVTYQSAVTENEKSVVRSVVLVNSAQMKITMLEYSTTNEAECQALQTWLQKNGYKKTVNTVEGKKMYFFQGSAGMIRYFEEDDDLAGGTKVKRGTFAATY